MEISGNYLINQLIDYALDVHLIEKIDSIYCANQFIDLFKLSSFEFVDTKKIDIYTLLERLCEYAFQHNIIESYDITTLDLFQTRIMNIITPRPSEVTKEFFKRYAINKTEATNYFYKLSIDCNYIRRNRILKNICYPHTTEYGTLDITINLSKPEKDPKCIALAKSVLDTGYPKCAICYENMGFVGNLKQEARQNLRIIPILLNNEEYYFQYSPYAYYNEHAIIFNYKHIPMKIDKNTVLKLLQFVDQFDHYFIGSNADLPIVGGSILSHDHFQAGNYIFPMFKAKILKSYFLPGFEEIRIDYIHWPLDTLCLKGVNKKRILDLVELILKKWNSYSKPAIELYAYTNTTSHNTITPIVRKIDGEYQVYLSLRNNRTNKEFPDGIFHPKTTLHHIKKENIGLIEVMGLAVLPKRLKDEMSLLKKVLLKKVTLDNLNEEPLLKHKPWTEKLQTKYMFTEENIDYILNDEIGECFKEVLEDCSVFKYGDKIKEMDEFLLL